jgi:mannose-6-phosphate isomerase-like protein (cupin superfamily)
VINETHRERYRTQDQIRRDGAIGNLNDGTEVTIHAIPTRLIAWPGNGFHTESVHVLTLRPGVESESDRYDMAEVAMVCLKGKGEVFLRGRWVEIEAGDVAFFPAGVTHASSNPGANPTAATTMPVRCRGRSRCLVP